MREPSDTIGVDEASEAAEWAAGCGVLLGGVVALGATMGLAAALSAGAGPQLAWLGAGVAGGIMLLAGAWRLNSHGVHLRGGAVAPVLVMQAGVLAVACMLIWMMSRNGAAPFRGPRAGAVVLTGLLLSGPSLLNLRALVLCGGPHWRRRAPDWLNLLTIGGKYVFGSCVLLAIGLGLMVPHALVRRAPGRSESAAIGTLRAIATAQQQFRDCVMVDVDRDGTGEYGTPGELAGTAALRGTGGTRAATPFIAPILGVTDARGFAQKSGYYYALYLHTPTAADPEPGWCCYAWPNSRGQSGNRAFYADQDGAVMACPNTTEQYSGTATVPNPNAPDRETWVPAGN